MPHENENTNQDRKIDKLQLQMEFLEREFKEFKEIQKETNTRLEAIQKGFVGREEYREFQTLVGTLATQKDVTSVYKELNERTTDLEDWQTWALRTIVGLVIAGVVSAAYLLNK